LIKFDWTLSERLASVPLYSYVWPVSIRVFTQGVDQAADLGQREYGLVIRHH
jgi:hypothetical protein